MKQDPASLFRYLTHGVYVIGVTDGENDNAFTAAWVMQASFAPLLLALGINSAHSSYALLTRCGVFSVNVVGENGKDLAQRFGRPAATDKLAGVRWHRERTGAPILDEAIAWFDCDYVRECPAGDHVIVVGRVVAGVVTIPDAMPLAYRDTGDMDGSSSLYPEDFDKCGGH